MWMSDVYLQYECIIPLFDVSSEEKFYKTYVSWWHTILRIHKRVVIA